MMQRETAKQEKRKERLQLPSAEFIRMRLHNLQLGELHKNRKRLSYGIMFGCSFMGARELLGSVMCFEWDRWKNILHVFLTTVGGGLQVFFGAVLE